MNEKFKVLDIKITDGIKMILDKYQNDKYPKIFAFKALEMAIGKFLLDFDDEDYDPEFDVVLALTNIKADLRVLCFPDGGDEFNDWMTAIDRN